MLILYIDSFPTIGKDQDMADRYTQPIILIPPPFVVDGYDQDRSSLDNSTNCQLKHRLHLRNVGLPSLPTSLPIRDLLTTSLFY